MSRNSVYLLSRYRLMGAYLGQILAVMAGVMLLPLAMYCFYPSEAQLAYPFLLSGFILAGSGLLLRFALCRVPLKALDFNESSLVIFLTWAIMSVVGAIPYMMLSGMNFSHAVFDAVSGWTTTGLSLLNIPAAPPIILFYRAWAQFIGGAGFAVIMLSALTGVGAQQLYSAEGKGTLIQPNVLTSVRIVITLYTGYFIAGTIAYLLAGMTPLDAVVYCFCAISTGGFGNQVANIGYFDSPMIEYISIILMILGNLSFLTGYFLFKGKLKSVLRNGEVKVLAASLLISVPLVFFLVTSHLFASASKAFRVAAFESISAITTTGFFTVDYNHPLWREAGVFILVLLQLIGGGTCSTAGGIKQYRVYMMYKTILWHIKGSLRPGKAVVRNYIWEGDLKGYVSDARLRGIAAFVFLYLVLYVIGVVVIAFSTNPVTQANYGLKDSMFEFASALGTVGLSIGVSTTAAPLHVIWVETLGMLLGRLEIFVVVFALAKLIKDFFPAVSLRRKTSARGKRKIIG